MISRKTATLEAHAMFRKALSVLLMSGFAWFCLVLACWGSHGGKCRIANLGACQAGGIPTALARCAGPARGRGGARRDDGFVSAGTQAIRLGQPRPA